MWDVVAILALFAISAPIAGSGVFDARTEADGVGAFSIPALMFAICMPACIAMLGGYERTNRLLGLGPLPRLLAAAGFTSWAVWTVGALGGWELDLGQLTVVALASPLALLGIRRLAALDRRRTPERVLIVGSGMVARHINDLALRHPERGLQVVGLVDDDSQDQIPGIDPPLLGEMEDLRNVLRDERIDRVIVSFSQVSDTHVLKILRECDSQRVDVDVVPRLFDFLGPEPVVSSLGGLGLLSVTGARPGVVQRFLKRALDITVASTLLVLVSPALLATAIAIRIDDGPGVLFRQTRVGRGGRPFEIVKFRTMTKGAEKAQASELINEGPDAIVSVADAMKRQSDAWITRSGHFLRRTSLDELPQLWNVVKGDMSLVGPRPLRQYEVDALTDWEFSRQQVRPGITGLWQILGRSDIQWDERMQLDYSYVRHWSLRKDIAILARTAGVVLNRRGAM